MDKIALAALILAAAGILLSAALFAKLQSESKGRRDQTCKVAELAHRKDVRQLAQTYKFLADPPRSLRALVPLIRATLPLVEGDAKDRAPAFCDEPGIGLAEPDPVIPARPKALR